MKEIELKFLVPEAKVTSLMRQINIKSAVTQTLAAYYFDTPNRMLAKSGIALRIRKEGSEQDYKWVQTLKSSGDGMLARLEHNHILDSALAESASKDGSLQPDMSIYQDNDIFNGFVVDQLAKLNLSTDQTVNKGVLCQYITDVSRITRLVKKDSDVVEIAYDEGSVIHGIDAKQRMPIHELEFELAEGDLAFLFTTAKTWCKRYQLCLSTITKAERGGLLLANQPYPDATKSNLNALTTHRKMSQPAFLRAVVQNCLLQILPNATAIVSGSQDGGHVHQLRVGIRRLRTALKFFSGFSGHINPEWSPVLKQTFGLLGEYRDREILELKTQPMLEKLGAPFVNWSAERNQLKVMPIDAVRANDFQLMLLELIEFATSSPKQDMAQTDENAKQAVSRILATLFHKVCKGSDRFMALDIESQHDVRKRLKSLRYLSEFAAPMYKRKKAKAFMKYLEPAQEILGDYNDHIVGHEFYQAKTESEPNAWFAVGYFGANQTYSAEQCAHSLTTVKNAPTFW